MTADIEAIYANARKRSLTADGYAKTGRTGGVAHAEALQMVWDAGFAAGIEAAEAMSGENE